MHYLTIRSVTVHPDQFKDRNHCGRIIGDQPWIHVDVSTTVTVFEPLVGAKIRGKITKVAPVSLIYSMPDWGVD